MKQGEYIVERVLGHKFEVGELLFKLKFLGWPVPEPGDDDEWTLLQYCYFAPKLRII